jgi:hypothetical protein
MKLTLVERFTLQGVLPERDNFINMSKMQALREKLIPSDEEIKTYEIKSIENGRVIWNPEGSKYLIEIEIGEICFEIIKEELKKRNVAKTLIIQELSLYEKFVENGKKEKNVSKNDRKTDSETINNKDN